MNSSQKKKWKDIIDTLKKIGMDKHEIEKRISEIEKLDGWEPINLVELMSMKQEQLDQLLSYCWHDGKYRCHTVGITDLDIIQEKSYWVVTFSDDFGDPRFEVRSVDQPIKRLGDGEWDYGLFKKKK